MGALLCGVDVIGTDLMLLGALRRLGLPAAGLLEAEKKFRRVRGYRELAEPGRKLNSKLHSQQRVSLGAGQ